MEYSFTEVGRRYLATRLCVTAMSPGELYRAQYFVDLLKKYPRTYHLRGPYAKRPSGLTYIRHLFEGSERVPSLFATYGVEIIPKIVQGEYYYSLDDPKRVLDVIPPEPPAPEDYFRPEFKIDKLKATLDSLDERMKLLEVLVE